MKILLLPDKFKGTLTAKEVAGIMERAIKKSAPEAQVSAFPIADGGEGSLDCFFKLIKGEIRSLTVCGPEFKKITARYLLSGKSAVIEMAEASGLLLAEKKNPALSTSFGTGELICDALKQGAEKIILCIGGSATNDMGAGIAAALGVKFFDKLNKEFIPTGGTLQNIGSVEFKNIPKFELTVLCDVKNPLYGKNGAAYVYAPQKGADEKMVAALDRNLKYLSDLLTEKYKIDVSALEGGGAAGGVGAGMKAFFNAELKSGIETVLSLVPKSETEGADLVLTGEGRMDNSSLSGKVVGGVAEFFKGKAPVIAVVGEIARELDIARAEALPLRGIFSLIRTTGNFSEIAPFAAEDLELAVSQIIRVFNA